MISVRDSLAGRHLLVTGVTGFLGKVWLGMLLERVPDVKRVTVIIRGRRGDSAHDRFHRLAERSPAFRPLRQRLGESLHPFLEDKVHVVAGDVSERLCGLDEDTVAGLADVDAVVHFAGLTDFEPDPRQAIAINTRGGEYAADLAARMTARRFVHVSTAFVAGLGGGEIAERIQAGVSPNGTRFDPHEELGMLDARCGALETRRERIDFVMDRARELGWPNIYCYSKGLSEHLHAQRNDIRLTILRPAIVESARRYPFVGWNEGINTSGPLVWLLSSWFRSFPADPNIHFDVVPVDTVARGTIAALAAAVMDRAEPVYQFGSSHENPLQFERAINLTALAVRKMHDGTDAAPLDKLFIKYLDCVPRQGDEDPFPSLETLRWGAQKMREWVRNLKVEGRIPPAAQRSWGRRLDDRLKSWSMDWRKTDRTLASIEDMLVSYKPFIHDNDYVFRTDNIHALTEELPCEERDEFGFDIASLCWRDYWINTHVPGLKKWSLPLLKGDKAPEDPPPRRRLEPPKRAARAEQAPEPKAAKPAHGGGVAAVPMDLAGRDR